MEVDQAKASEAGLNQAIDEVDREEPDQLRQIGARDAGPVGAVVPIIPIIPAIAIAGHHAFFGAPKTQVATR